MDKKQHKIIEQIKKSDLNAFQYLFQNYYSGLLSFSEKYVRERRVAEEIVDDLFIHLWEIRKKIQIRDSIEAYLYRSVYNRCISYIRNKNKQANLTSQIAVSIENKIYSIPETSSSPLNQVMNKDLKKQLDKALNELPDKCKEIFILSREYGLKYEEIAERLNISVNTVKTQLKIALKRLRESLKNIERE
jgi:RNA polymerase sigma-70 factor, ECF subfamily